jgi:aerobic carbon-monoxide dehydrogenase medium subunit
VKPALFKYFDPSSTDEALVLLSEWGEDGKVLAGGQTLSPMLNFRVITPSALIDVNGVKELAYHIHSDSGTVIGAMTRQQALEDDGTLAAHQPLVAAAIPLIAHRAVRNRGTVGGSLAHADPAAEWGGLALTLQAELRIRKSRSPDRVVQAANFFRDMLDTVIEPDELLVEIKLPAWPAGAGWSFIEFSRRHGDFALAGVACQMSCASDGNCLDVRLTAFGVGATPIRLTGSESLLLGTRCRGNAVKEAARRARTEVSPLDDNHASATYRRHLVGVLVERSIKEAVSRTAPC